MSRGMENNACVVISLNRFETTSQGGFDDHPVSRSGFDESGSSPDSVVNRFEPIPLSQCEQALSLVQWYHIATHPVHICTLRSCGKPTLHYILIGVCLHTLHN